MRRSIAAQVALARKDSPVQGNRHVGFAKAMVEEMPHTFQALQDGRISEGARPCWSGKPRACLSNIAAWWMPNSPTGSVNWVTSKPLAPRPASGNASTRKHG